MDLTAIVQSIDAEINHLKKARALFTGHTAPLKRGFPPRRSEPQYDERGGTSKGRRSTKEKVGEDETKVSA